MNVADLFIAGIKAIIEYVSAHVLTCLVPAFFIAGAMTALLPKENITRLLGQKAPKHKAYPLAVVAGLMLAVCSCTILPLFAGIKKKGAGTGPALAFLYTAPATNILAILFTGSVLGWNFAISRIVLSVTFAILIGLIISALFKEEDARDEKNTVSEVMSAEKQASEELSFFQKHRLFAFFFALVAILIAGTRVKGPAKYMIISLLIITLAVLAKLLFSNEEIKSWFSETWMFTKKIFPLLLVGIFISGVLTALLPQNFLATFMGRSTVPANLIAVLFGVFMYFPTLVEVPMAKMFLNLGMAKGPLLAYLLADPVISLASILVVRKFLGNKRTLVYVGLIIVFTTISGLIYGAIVG